MSLMHVTLLGTGTSVPDAERVQSGLLLEIDGEPILIDIGPGVLHRLIQTGTDLRRLQHVFITHTHVDHCSDLVPLYQTLWMSGYDKTLNIYIPTGGIQWLDTLFESVYPYLKSKIKMQTVEMHDRFTTTIGQARVTAWKTRHSTIQTRSIRVDYGGHSLVFSSDTAPDPDGIAMARGVDVLIHECNWLDGSHPPDVHTSPSELAAIVAAIQPQTVILTHMLPEVVGASEQVKRTVRSTTGATVLLGHDLLRLTLE